MRQALPGHAGFRATLSHLSQSAVLVSVLVRQFHVLFSFFHASGASRNFREYINQLGQPSATPNPVGWSDSLGLYYSNVRAIGQFPTNL
jgi:hypothetical protein